MPVILPSVVRRLTHREFHALDYQVMRVAFDIQNELGCHLEEGIYERELLHRLRAQDIAVQPQFPIVLRHGDYETILAADLLVGDSTVYELKVATALVEAHRTQALTYVLLTETQHGKLVNFGSPKVSSEFVSTTLTAAKRREMTVRAERWCDTSASAQCLKSVMFELAHDWGLFLHIAIYRQALAHFLGGAAQVRQTIPLFLGQRSLGYQEFDVLDSDALLTLTALKETKMAEVHYRRLLELTRLHYVHWINLCKHEIQFISLERSH